MGDRMEGDRGMNASVVHDETAIRTQRRAQWVDVTAAVERMVRNSGIRDGICLVSSPHTTAGMTINENADPDVQSDFFSIINRLVPQDPSLHHGEGNSDSHCKASLVGFGVQVPVAGGALSLGTWQAIYFCEFDGPRQRRVQVTIIGV